YLLLPTHGVLIRALVCIIVLTPPTMLMGATLPAIARWRIGERQAANVSLLYMANLVGATTGTVMAGFYLLRVYDTIVATRVAVAVNFVVATAFYALARATSNATVEQVERLERVELPEDSGAAIYWAAALSGFSALGAEVVWTRQLSLLFGASVYTFSLILAVFLFGLWAGSVAGSFLVRRIRHPRLALATAQILLGVAIAGTAYTLSYSL